MPTSSFAEPHQLQTARLSSPREPRANPWLADPLLNKGTAYTDAERADGKFEGLLPPRVETLEEQAQRAYESICAAPTPLDRYRYLSAVQRENETLFYRVLGDHLDTLLPVVYTPTVGEACVKWSRIYERPRGLYLSAVRHRGRMARVLRNWPRAEVGVIVVTDGGRILGLGDLGANGMGIPVGKLALYTACAGVPPSACLPVLLDVGTNNELLRNDPLYLGERVERLTGTAYDEVLEEFVSAVEAAFPGAILQFEDFNNAAAFRLLEQYRDRLCCFNDDVQGTGAIGLAGLYAAGRMTGRALTDERILFAGAGEACLGVAAMRAAGLSEQEALERCLFVDSCGLVVRSRADLPAHKQCFAQDRPSLPTLEAAVAAFQPTVLIGASGQGGLFTEAVLRSLASVTARPVVFALSNPTSKAECTAEQACEFTGGRAIFASGSPFPPVAVGVRIVSFAQANNSYIFPGVGLGLRACGARRATDTMFFAAARALASQATDDDIRQGLVFPPQSRMREVALAVATAVAGVAYDEGLASVPRPDNLRDALARSMYVPSYS